MISISEDFNNALKAQVIRARAKVVFNYATPLTLYRDKIISIDAISSGEIALGCVQDDKVTCRFSYDAFTIAQYNQRVDVELYFGCVVNDVEEYVLIGTYKTNRWQADDQEKFIEVELVSKISTDQVEDLLPATNVSLKDYITSACGVLMNETVTIGDSCLDATLSQCYLYAKTIKEQLKLFGVAINGVFRYVQGLECAPYKFTTDSKEIKLGANESLLYYKKENDYLDSKAIVQIMISAFTKSDNASLYSATVNIPKGVDSYNVKLDFGTPSIINYIQFKKYSYFYTVDASLWSAMLRLGVLTASVASRVDLTCYGVKIQSNVLGSTSDNSKTYISNPYIQNSSQAGSLDASIYTSDKYVLSLKGDPTIQIGDTIGVEGLGNIMVTKHSIKFDGSLLSTVEGVLKVE